MLKIVECGGRMPTDFFFFRDFGLGRASKWLFMGLLFRLLSLNVDGLLAYFLIFFSFTDSDWY